MRRTGAPELVLLFLVALGIVHIVLRQVYGSLAPASFFMPVPLAVLAVLEFIVARRVRGAIAHDPETKAMTAIAIARCAALGKASALAAAVVAGLFAGLLIRVFPTVSTVTAARHDATVAGIGLAACALLLAAGLVLERSALMPNNHKT